MTLSFAPNPVLVLLPKALLRVRGEQKIPGEPDEESELRDRIDAPVQDRDKWKPRWPDVQQPLLSSRVMILCGAFARTRVRSPQIIDGRTEPYSLAQVSKLAALAGTKHTDRFPLAKSKFRR